MPALPGHRDLEHLVGQGSQSHAPEVLQAGRIGEEFAGFAFLLKVQRRSRLDESPARRRSGGSAPSPVASRRSAGSPESAAAPRSRSRRSLPGPTSGSGRGASAGVQRACSPPRAARAPRRAGRPSSRAGRRPSSQVGLVVRGGGPGGSDAGVRCHGSGRGLRVALADSRKIPGHLKEGHPRRRRPPTPHGKPRLDSRQSSSGFATTRRRPWPTRANRPSRFAWRPGR